MKNSLLCLTALLLAAALAACGSSFSGSRIGTDTQLLMEYEIFNTTDSQSLAMEAGDLVTIDVVSEAGQLAVHIQPQDGESIFDAADLTTGHYEVTVPQDGIYQCAATGRRARGSVRIANQTAKAVQSLENTYYAGQDAAAFALFQKTISVDGWATGLPGTEAPLWREGTFARYYLLDSGLTPVNSEDLYYCTFSAEEGRYGYAVFSHSGEALSMIRAAETPYPYDLRHKRAAVKGVLHESGLRLNAPTAARVQLADGAEAILLKDDSGACSVYRFPA